MEHFDHSPRKLVQMCTHAKEEEEEGCIQEISNGDLRGVVTSEGSRLGVDY